MCCFMVKCWVFMVKCVALSKAWVGIQSAMLALIGLCESYLLEDDFLSRKRR